MIEQKTLFGLPIVMSDDIPSIPQGEPLKLMTLDDWAIQENKKAWEGVGISLVNDSREIVELEVKEYKADGVVLGVVSDKGDGNE